MKNFYKNKKEYQSRVWVLLFLMEYSKHDIANATRELSKANNGMKPAAFKKLLYVIQ